jgi:hypothetical protein
MFAWILGLFVAVVLGHYGTKYFLEWLRTKMGLGEKPGAKSEWMRVSPGITGVIERMFFAIIIAVDISGAGTAMVGWLALKLATNWNHPDWKDDPTARSFAFSALLAGLVSMSFAVVGGLICR